MKLKHLKLYFFKNHKNFNFSTNAKAVGIYGLNGAGKTNILDAIYMLCCGRSYFTATDLQCINSESDDAGIVGLIEQDGEVDVKIKLGRGKRKSIEQQGKKISKIIDYVGHFFAVVIAPGDIELVYGGNAERRKFIDQIIGQTDPLYLRHLVSYQKRMEQRNSHLKSDYVDVFLLDTLDVKLNEDANLIYEKRKDFMNQFIPMVQHNYHLLSGDKETISLHYLSELEKSAYLDLAKFNRQKDKITKRSNSGTHKDEIELMLNDFVLKKYGSQGQIKSALIALKLAEFEYYRQKMNVIPVLLLDDIFEKIDEERALQLTSIIKNGNFEQLFVSDTQENRLRAFCEAISTEHQLIAL